MSLQSTYSFRLLHRTVSLVAALSLPLVVHADTVILNAQGVTLTKAGSVQTFQALAFNDAGRILSLGNNAVIKARYPKATFIDLQGKAVLPGLIDAHGHVAGLGEQPLQLDLHLTRSLSAAQSAITQFAQTRPTAPWIIGRGWNQANWKLGRFPTAADLDSVLSDRPAWLTRVDGHAGWANTRALTMAGITRDSIDPQGGKIERDAQGNPTGVLVDRAMALMEKVLPQLTEADRRAGLDLALQEIASLGLTSVHDAGVDAVGDKLYREYAVRNTLTARIYGMIDGTGPFFDSLEKTGPMLSYQRDMYALRAVKLYADGALGSRGAAMLAPYQDADTRGLLFVSDAEMLAQMQRAVARGYQVNVHAIGDGGNRQVLDALSKVVKTPATRALRHRVEHAQVVALSDIPRFKTLGIIPSMQPTHATSDMNMAEDRVGGERIKGAYAWRTFLKQGSAIACGSDFPVESANPFWGIHAAVTRQDMESQPSKGWRPEQALTVTEALRCFTLDAAAAAHQEKVLGSLEPGKWADFIVTDQNLMSMPAKDIFKMRVLQTWVAGRQVFVQP